VLCSVGAKGGKEVMASHYVAHMCCAFVAQRTRVGQPVWPRVIL